MAFTGQRPLPADSPIYAQHAVRAKKGLSSRLSVRTMPSPRLGLSYIVRPAHDSYIVRPAHDTWKLLLRRMISDPKSFKNSTTIPEKHSDTEPHTTSSSYAGDNLPLHLDL